jgi:hypothetical protein
MTTVYIVTSGSYSDYTIEHVFATEELAQDYCDKLGGDNPGIEAYEVKTNPVERRVLYRLNWYTWLEDRPGDGLACPNPYIYSSVTDYEPGPHFSVTSWATDSHGRDLLSVEAWAEERLMKIYGDEKAQYLARKEGIA